MFSLKRLTSFTSLVVRKNKTANGDASAPPHYLLADERYARTIKAVSPFTMTSFERIAALTDATRHVVHAKIPGAIVECGVWRGGSMMAAALTLLEENQIRDLYLFDTFTGMTEPKDNDVDYEGLAAKKIYDETVVGEQKWCYAGLDDVRRNLLSTGYPEERLHFIAGDVLQTIPQDGLDEIAVLRLDTDWYESTLHELKQLYPKLNAGGILIIDDFGYWQGCRKAVQEYFGDSGPFLSIIDHTARLAVKTGLN
jgi:O-methyltransferase